MQLLYPTLPIDAKTKKAQKGLLQRIARPRNRLAKMTKLTGTIIGGFRGHAT